MIVDSHVHSSYSLDAKNTVMELCLAAIQNGVDGFAVTDHISARGKEHCVGGVESLGEEEVFRRLLDSNRDALAAQGDYGGKILVLAGMELGEASLNPEMVRQLLSLCKLDVVLSSTHLTKTCEIPSITSFRNWTDQEIAAYLQCYFAETCVNIKASDFDVLAHLTLPLRYIETQTCKDTDLSGCREQLDECLRLLVAGGRALELNVSGLNIKWNKSMPEAQTIRRYRELGGALITIGSDSHTAAGIGNGVKHGMRMLRECGYTYYYYYKDRKPVAVRLD